MNKWIHIIGVSGVATSAIAVMFKKAGWKVTGSDKAFFPPASLYLKDNGIEIMTGFKPEHLYDAKGEYPKLVMYQGTKGENNPEINFARENEIKLQHIGQIMRDFIEVENSILITGTMGKTSITSMLVQMLLSANKNVSYMFGGIPQTSNFVNALIKDEKTEYSIIEGDEYMAAIDDPISKFHFFKPKYLVINAISWEHLDMFPTEKEYILNFKRLVNSLRSDAIIFANSNDKNVVNVLSDVKVKVIYYSADLMQAKNKPNWYLLGGSKPLPSYIKVDSKGIPIEIIPFERRVIGDFNESNFLAATALAYEIDIRKERIEEGIKQFIGVKRRLEIVYRSKDNNLLIVDDLGSSPPKAKGVIASVVKDYPDAKIIVIFEPNAGNRISSALPLFADVFESVDCVLLPKFSRLPKSAKVERYAETQLVEAIKISNQNVQFIVDDNLLVKKVIENIEEKKQNIVLMLSSHSLHGIPELIKTEYEKSSIS